MNMKFYRSPAYLFEHVPGLVDGQPGVGRLALDEDYVHWGLLAWVGGGAHLVMYIVYEK